MTPANDPRVQRTRRCAIESTLHLLCTQGYSGVTFEAVSQYSGIARSTLYRQWPTTSELIHDALDSIVEPATPRETGDLQTDLRQLLGHIQRKLTATSWGALLPAIVDAGARDPHIAEFQRQYSEQRRLIAHAIAKRGIESGQFPDDADVDLVAEQLIGPIFFRFLVSHQPIDNAYIDRLYSSVITPLFDEPNA